MAWSSLDGVPTQRHCTLITHHVSNTNCSRAKSPRGWKYRNPNHRGNLSRFGPFRGERRCHASAGMSPRLASERKPICVGKRQFLQSLLYWPVCSCLCGRADRCKRSADRPAGRRTLLHPPEKGGSGTPAFRASKISVVQRRANCCSPTSGKSRSRTLLRRLICRSRSTSVSQSLLEVLVPQGPALVSCRDH